MKNTDILWQSAQEIIQKHLNHPFSIDLAAGKLSNKVFKFYLQQDAIYIKKYAQAMTLLSEKAPSGEIKDIFAKLAIDSYELEHIFQENLFSRYEIKASKLMQPACLAYSSFLLATIANGSFIEGLTSLLPCFWVYLENGKNIAKNSVENNPYQDWIDTYVSEDFIQQTEQVKKFVNIYSQDISKQNMTQLCEIFSYSCRLDLQFMDDAYNTKTWYD